MSIARPASAVEPDFDGVTRIRVFSEITGQGRMLPEIEIAAAPSVTSGARRLELPVRDGELPLRRTTGRGEPPPRRQARRQESRAFSGRAVLRVKIRQSPLAGVPCAPADRRRG